MSADFGQIRQQFPILGQAGLVYLDSAASSQKPQSVIDGVKAFYESDYANIHRGAHFLGDRATEKFEQARKKTADFLGAASAREVVFTRNATEGINLVARSLGDMDFFAPGDRIILTRMEHHANLVPCFQLAKKLDLEIAYLEINEQRELVLDNLDELLKPPTKLLAFPQVSNMLGTQNPAKELCRKARQKGVLSLVDAAQSVPHFPVAVADLDCDFLVFSSHKTYGPSGVGVLYGKLDLLKKLPPFLGGGEMIREVTYDGFTPNEVPYKFEAGTQAIAEVHGLGLAIDFLQNIGMDNVKQHDAEVTEYAFKALSQLPELRLFSHPQAKGLVTFVAKDMQSYDIADFLSDRGICVRAGHHCAEPLHHYLGINTSLRASFGLYSTKAEVDLLTDNLKQAILELR